MFNAGHQNPPRDGTEALPHVMQAMPIVRRRIEATPDWFTQVGDDAEAYADAIINKYNGVINWFWQSQRANLQQGIVPVSTTQFKPNGQLLLQFQAVQNTMILSITVYPQNELTNPEKQLTDINHDGYVAWLHNEAGYPDIINGKPTVSGPYDVFVNGYLVLTNLEIKQMNSIFVVMFGPTALQLHSQHDDVNPFNKKPNSLLAPITPGRPDIKAMPGTYGATIPAHKDLPLYAVFDWGDPLNPNRWALDGQEGTTPLWTGQTWDEYTAAAVTSDSGSTTETIIQGIQFDSADKSPLKATGDNFITIQVSTGGTAGDTTYNAANDIMLGEFFDRKKLRLVYSTPKYPTQLPGQTVITNDKPLYWGGFAENSQLHGSTSTFVGSGAMTLEIDLTPADTYPLASALGEAPTSQLMYYPPTQNMQNLWDAYGQAFDEYSNAIGPWAQNYSTAYFALQNASNVYTAAFNAAHLWGPFYAEPAPMPALAHAAAAADAAVGPAALAFTGNPDAANAAAYTAAINAAVAADTAAYQAQIILNDNPTATAYWNNLIALDNAFLAATLNFIAAAQNEPKAPTAPNFSSAGSLSIDPFKYRYFTVSNGEFQFGAWQGGS